MHIHKCFAWIWKNAYAFQGVSLLSIVEMYRPKNWQNYTVWRNYPKLSKVYCEISRGGVNSNLAMLIEIIRIFHKFLWISNFQYTHIKKQSLKCSESGRQILLALTILTAAWKLKFPLELPKVTLISKANSSNWFNVISKSYQRYLRS